MTSTSNPTRWQLGIAAVGVAVCAFPDLVMEPVDDVLGAITGQIQLIPVTALWAWLAVSVLLGVTTLIGVVHSGQRRLPLQTTILGLASVVQISLFSIQCLHQ